MPRPISQNLANLLPSCFSNSTAEIYLRDGRKYFLSGTDFPFSLPGYAEPFTPGLIRVGEVQESLGAAANLVALKVANTNDFWSILAAHPDRPLELAKVVVKSWKRDRETNPNIQSHDHYFTGKCVKSTPEETASGDAAARVITRTISLDVVLDTTAAGTCLATGTLSPANGWVFPEAQAASLPTSDAAAGGGIAPDGGYNNRNGGDSCFIAGTFVETPDGAVEIQNAAAGAAVWSFNPETFAIEADTVVACFEHTAPGYYEAEFSNGKTLSVTGEHRFLTASGKFTRIDELTKGQTVFVKSGRELKEVLFVGKSWVPNAVRVYNIHVLKNRTYFAEGFAVHNLKRAPGDIFLDY